MLLNEINKEKPIHMIGIGGTSMSGIAEIALKMGFKITGSDRTLTPVTDRLVENGIIVYEGHNASNVENASLVVYTAAISKDNPEMLHARELNIPMMERSEFLGEITRLYSKTISVCGTHGKTTTTGMISTVFVEGGKDPSVQVGADIKALENLNYRVGNSDYFIVESCEYVRSFLQFHPQTVALLNIEEDHLDYYKDIEDIKSAFRDFVNLVPETGLVVVNADDKNCIEVAQNLKCKTIKIGIENQSANYIAKNISVDNDGHYSFDVAYADSSYHITLGVPGYHHIYNALFTIAISISNGIAIEQIASSIQRFTGAARRFEYVGKINDAKIYDDYAHHPTEIKAIINTATNIEHNKIWVIFQPHTFSRTKALFNEFTDAFEKADNLILIDIYAAREIDDGTVSSKMLADKINEKYNNCTYIPSIEEAVQYIKEHVMPNDIVLTVGAGTITKLGYMIKE